MADQPKASADILNKQVVYDGEGYTRQSIEGMLTDYQSKHELSLKKFEELSSAYKNLSQEMTADIASQKSTMEYLGDLFTLHDVGTNIKGLIYKLPLLKDVAPSRDLKELL
ncbi:MAG: hypothetical protein KGL53_00585, partial [Elusimicrobia bacterium]|nr:hypothetical protein [Elusimicrobiota bacterium]